MVLPLANIAFTLDFIMGKEATTLSPYDIAGLVVILIGLVIYRSTSEQAPPTTSADGVVSDEVRVSVCACAACAVVCACAVLTLVGV